MSLSELSRLIGRNSSYLQQFVRRGSPRKLEESDRHILARFFGVDESALGAPEEISSAAGGKKAPPEWADVSRLELGVSAGPGSVAFEEQTVGILRFSRQWFREQGLSPSMLSAVAVAGDSMEPTLRDGDEILVDRTPGPLRDGVHVVRIDSTLLVKRLDTSLLGRLSLISDNQSYGPIEVSLSEVEVVGKVVWKSGRM
ncbi:MAG: S24 family peptidase [Sphingomonadaceae bacterium]|nr:S24 family peptidase [Sphingomonadaceae bacterium]